MQSKRYTLNETDWVKIAKGALIAAIGAALTFITQQLGLTETVQTVVGEASEPELVVDGFIPPQVAWMLFSVLTNFIWKLWRE